MKIIMVAAVSQDGFITRGDDSDVSSWTSKEDKQFFNKIKSEHKLYVMGSKTYDSGSVKPTKGVLRVILTSNPDRYAGQSVKGQLEFMNLTPQEFVKKYKNTYKTCLLLGGSHIYEAFGNAKLIDEVYLTIEPVTFGSGTPLIASGASIHDVGGLKSVETKTLNAQGTKLEHYVME